MRNFNIPCVPFIYNYYINVECFPVCLTGDPSVFNRRSSKIIHSHYEVFVVTFQSIHIFLFFRKHSAPSEVIAV